MIGRMGVLVLLFTAMSSAGFAQAAAQGAAADQAPPSRAQVMTLMSAMGVQQNVDASLLATRDKVKRAARTSFDKKNPDADEATLKKLDEVFDSTPFFTFQDIAEALIPVYQKNLSAVDVQAGIDFYSSESGRRLLAKLPEILREANAAGRPLVEQKLQAYGDELERKLGEFQSWLNQQKSPAAPQSKPVDDSGKSKDDQSK